MMDEDANVTCIVRRWWVASLHIVVQGPQYYLTCIKAPKLQAPT